MRHALTFVPFACAVILSTATFVLAARYADEPSDMLVIRSAGLGAIADHPKDEGFVRALNMLIKHRLPELPAELGEDFPAAAVQLVLELLSGPFTAQIDLQPDMPPHAGLSVHLNFPAPDAPAAEAMARRFRGTLAGMMPFHPEPVPDQPGMQVFHPGPVPIYFGATAVGGQHAFTIAVNMISPHRAELGRLDLPEGVEPVFAFAFDSRRVQSLIEFFAEDDAHDMAPAMAQLRAMGLLGPDAAVISAAIGHGPNPGEPAHVAMRFTNYRALLERTGMWPDAMLSAADLRRVPADATYAQISRTNLSAALQMMRQVIPDEEDFEELMDQIEANTGVHPQRDVFDHLGQVAAVYMSDTTGSGGMLSLAAFVEVTNPDDLSETLARATGAANQMAQMAARGYIRFTEREVNGERLTTLTFPGLPVPLEISFALADGFLYAAATPQGLLAAIAQGRGNRPGLMENPRFTQSISGDIAGAMQVTFYDTPRTLRAGYTLATLGASALANAVRSPTDTDRDPGLILPSLAELAEGARAAAYIVRFDGNDMVMTGSFDRSWLVMGTGTAGTIGGTQGVAGAALLTGLTLPALGKAREQATVTRSQSNLRQIALGMYAYAAEFNDRLPPTVETLAEQGYIDEMLLRSPFGPAADGGDDYFFNLSLTKLSDAVYPDKHVLAYDRAMLATHGRTVVLFYDGHNQAMNSYEFSLIREHTANEGVDFNLPWEW